MSYYQIHDNVLPQEQFQQLKTFILSNNFSWFYSPYKVASDKYDGANEMYDFQFTHNFYSDYSPKSPFISLIEPIIQIINPKSIVRIKANLTTSTPKIINYGYHKDLDFRGETAIFYINSNDGYTIFEDGTRVESIENRLLRFDSQMIHTGTSCTNEKVRCVLNLNYYTK